MLRMPEKTPPPSPLSYYLHQCLNTRKCLVCAVPKYCWSYRAETGALPIRFGRRTDKGTSDPRAKDVEECSPRTEKGKGMGNLPLLALGVASA